MEYAIIFSIALLVGVIWYLRRSRKRQAERLEQASGTAVATGLSTSRPLFDGSAQHAPLEEFHVEGSQAKVVFDVPLPDDDDNVLHDLLLEEAVEVVRQRRHTLPIDDVTEIVVYAGRGERKMIGTTQLPSQGELPPPGVTVGLSFSHVAHDPFSAPFEDERSDHSVVFGTSDDVPADELGPLSSELRIPRGLERGLRATGVDPDEMDGPLFVLALLKMFGYSVTEQAQPNSYIGLKDGQSVYILTEAYAKGDHPEVDEGLIRKFLVDYETSGADRGMLLSDKYGPFMVNEIERHQPKVRFITRERIQGFVDSMALG